MVSDLFHSVVENTQRCPSAQEHMFLLHRGGLEAYERVSKDHVRNP